MAYTRSTTFRYRFDRSSTINGSTSDLSFNFSQADLKTGQRVENWRRKIQLALPAGSPYSRTAWRVKAEAASGSIKATHRLSSSVKRDVSFSGVLHANQNVAGLTVSSPENEALTRLYSAIRQKQQGMNGLLILGELKETIALLRKPGSALIELFGNYLGTSKGIRKTWEQKKGRRRQDLEKSLSGLWLEYSFGWKPLISDVRDIATTAARIATDNALRTDRARGTAGTSNASSDVFTSQDLVLSGSGPVYHCSRKRHTDLGCRYVAGLDARLYGPTDSLMGLARETGFSLDNFVPTVWNLIPYSFLVDYFTNIGNCIESVFTDTSAVVWWSKTVRQVDSTHLSCSFDPALTIVNWLQQDWVVRSLSCSSSTSEYVRTTLNRTFGTVLPFPGLTLSLPAVDSSKYWNLLALWKGKAAGAHM